jgi:hypothetical protein
VRHYIWSSSFFLDQCIRGPPKQDKAEAGVVKFGSVFDLVSALYLIPTVIWVVVPPNNVLRHGSFGEQERGRSRDCPSPSTTIVDIRLMRAKIPARLLVQEPFKSLASLV